MSTGLRWKCVISDKECRICAVQVETAHLPLGFHPTIEYEGETVVENQFLNVGLGIHVKPEFDTYDR